MYWQRRQLVRVAIGVLLAPLVLGGDGRSRLVVALSSRPVVLLGAVSYGVYLWHLGWINLIADSVSSSGDHLLGYGVAPGGSRAFLLLVAAGLGLGTASALVSWYGVERPLVRWVRGR